MDEARYHHGNLRQALIGAALAAIRASGTEAVSLRALARDLGVSHAAPARHFASRDALFAAIAEQGYRELADCVTAAGTGVGDPLAALSRMAAAHLDWVRANPGLYGAMRNAEIVRHADAALIGRIRSVAARQIAAVKAARATGWRQDEPLAVTFLGIIGGLAGIGAMLSDPVLSAIAAEAEGGIPTEALIARLLAP
jgi:AcrR family transcriptional regulator